MLQAQGHNYKREFSAILIAMGLVNHDGSVDRYSFGAGRLRVGLIQSGWQALRCKRFTR